MKTKRGNPNWGNGKSGNPNGRPKKDKTLTALMDKAGDQLEKYKLPDGTEKELTRKQVLVELIWRNVKRYDEERNTYIIDYALLNLILNRLEGYPIAAHEIGGVGGGPISLKFSTALDDEDLDDGYIDKETNDKGAKV